MGTACSTYLWSPFPHLLFAHLPSLTYGTTSDPREGPLSSCTLSRAPAHSRCSDTTEGKEDRAGPGPALLLQEAARSLAARFLPPALCVAGGPGFSSFRLLTRSPRTNHRPSPSFSLCLCETSRHVPLPEYRWRRWVPSQHDSTSARRALLFPPDLCLGPVGNPPTFSRKFTPKASGRA